MKKLEISENFNSELLFKIQILEKEIIDKNRLNDLKMSKLAVNERLLGQLQGELGEKTDLLRGYEKKSMNN